ncbi:HAMP domain-containing protein [Geomonas sp. RF6]|uniref:HAMP domain-containing protein n=1 Tax=Geomonas sp. RF6 TaxID=2897342 RepID=UPI001E608AD3|nr:HAMP domain-containing protein [Geomonas sp. RF6]UFS71534.1 HAMP domain-containing protein [Geomonas sp. RF6]
MFRTLTARAVVPVAMAITGFVVICCVLLYAAVKEDLTHGAIEQEKSLAATVIKSAHYTMLKADREGLSNIVRNIGEGRGVEHVRIVNTEGVVAFSSRDAEVGTPGPKGAAEGAHAATPLPEGRRLVNANGTEILAISVPIPNEAACSNASCHVHDKAQQTLGTLEIAVSTEPLHRSLALVRNRMLLFCIMVLLLTIGGVAALLQRNIFTPIRQLTEYSDRAAAGETREPFSHRCAEIGKLARNISTLAERANSSAAGTGAESRKGADAAS